MAGDTTIRYGKATVRFEGFAELFGKLERVGGEAKAAAVEVFNAAIEDVYAMSQMLVPVDAEDGGELKASGRKSKARISRADVVTASVSYGGPTLARLAPGQNPIYAIVQHEDLSLKHDHGEAKFLEKPYLIERRDVEAELGRRIAQRIGAT